LKAGLLIIAFGGSKFFIGSICVFFWLALLACIAAIDLKITIEADHNSLAGFLASAGRSNRPACTEANMHAKRRQGGDVALRVTKENHPI